MTGLTNRTRNTLLSTCLPLPVAIGPRIRQARLLRGLSQRGLADKLPVSYQTVSNYERERSLPDSGMLMKIAGALDVDLSYFLRAPLVGEVRPAVPWLVSTPEKEKKRLTEQIRDWLERYLETESIISAEAVAPWPGPEWPEGFPRELQPEEPGSKEGNEETGEAQAPQIEAAAVDLRCDWDLGTGPIDRFAERLEDRGLRVGSLPAPDWMDGRAFLAEVGEKSSEEGSSQKQGAAEGEPVYKEPADGKLLPVIVFNAALPGARQRFLIGRELGRLALRPGQLGEDSGEKSTTKVEKAYERFGRAFLIPRPALVRDVGMRRRHLSSEELRLVSEKYGASPQLLIRRLEEAGILSSSRTEKWLRRLREAGSSEQDLVPAVQNERPGRLRRLVLRARSENVISERSAEELLGESVEPPAEPSYLRSC
jgi:transcriptional regulator with XRE-family HTH domain/Zn-dependent peptidase ImmA (M78 family)